MRVYRANGLIALLISLVGLAIFIALLIFFVKLIIFALPVLLIIFIIYYLFRSKINRWILSFILKRSFNVKTPKQKENKNTKLDNSIDVDFKVK